MGQNLDLEIKVIQRFINKSKQARYIQFVTSSKNRPKFIADLSRVGFLQEGAFDKVMGIEEEVIRQALQLHGIADSTCYVISENARLDTQTLAISEALRATVGQGMGTILVFGNADLVYYECETRNIRYISKPKQNLAIG
ncbi:hypothetical protein SAMN00120144_4226 [Hymenobacter roseosalivarius DSM 11622]|uniref:Uncharacterized protein n=1 Tax=Hymenobacter roseosalivarius DSM 11622 TaxID=645990 RepID=A0A1W1UFJ3_9BACT|nr:hypothetical protein [Hymenobacter roseosalivarius]SMB79803.1 hypothetical protein SAMN00120144_4226 [Hymenobacter roseosalivarius DSM 11622]